MFICLCTLRLFVHVSISTITINVKGRDFKIENFYEGIAKFNFNELCDQNIGVEDYLEIWHSLEDTFDGAIYDPPFSDRQAKEAYQQTTNLYTLGGKILRIERSLGDLIIPGGYVVKFGYNSNFSHKAFECVEIKLVRYGGSMNDMIVSVHKKMFETFKDLGVFDGEE